jgi:hypothetical protein
MLGRSAVEDARVQHVVPRGEDLAERVRRRGHARDLREHGFVVFVFRLLIRDLVYFMIEHSGRPMCGGRELRVNERPHGVQQRLLRRVRAQGVHADRGRQQAARVQEQVQISRALCGVVGGCRHEM